MMGDVDLFIENLDPEILASFVTYNQLLGKAAGYKQAVHDLRRGAVLIGEQAAIRRIEEFFAFADELDEASAKAFLDCPS